jgi:hypothetical protein
MAELERDLRELGTALEFPPTPDLATAVRRRLAAEPALGPRFRFGGRRALVLAFAVLAVAVGATMAVPSARTAILEWLGLRGVQIERTETSPARGPAAGSDLSDAERSLGEPVTLDEARARARYRVVVPPEELGEPDAIYFLESGPGGQVSFAYRDDGELAVLVSEFAAGLDRDFIYKSVGPNTRVERADVDGQLGWWLEGEPHEFVYLDRELGDIRPETLRLATNTLLWVRGDLTLRIEGADLTKERALRIAEGFRPA